MLHQKQQFLQDQALVNRDRNRSIPGSVGDFIDRPGSPGSGYDDDDDDSLGGLTGGYKSSGLRKYSKSVCQKVKEQLHYLYLHYLYLHYNTYLMNKLYYSILLTS